MAAVWEPLVPEQNQIRLVRFVTSNDHDDFIALSLEVVSLSSKPVFEALSYACGDGTKDATIKLNGVKHSIGHPLFTALQHLQRCNDKSLYWIDALCIHQDDLDEKAAQILLMRHIFERASRVRIWLGKSDHDSLAAFATLQRILVLLKSGKRYDVIETIDILKTYTVTGIVPLLNRPWFHRVWTVQEASLAKLALVSCGSDSMQWRDFIETTSWIIKTIFEATNNHDEAGIIFLGLNSSELINSLSSSISCFRQIEVSLAHYSDRSNINSLIALLTSILRVTIGRKATNPHDHIYGILGLLGGEANRIIKPDYRRSLLATYGQITYGVLVQAGIDDMFALAERVDNNISNLPSWVPDFSCMSPSARASMTKVLRIPNFHAGSTDDRQDYLLSTEGTSILVMNGNRVSTLKRLSPSSFQYVSEGFKSVFQDWEDMIAMYLHDDWSHEYISGGTILEAYERTVFNDTAYIDYQELYARPTERPTREQFAEFWTARQEEAARPSKMMLHLHSMNRHRRMSITQHGQLALVPLSAQEGDIVCVIQGARFPYVIRPSTVVESYPPSVPIPTKFDGTTFELVGQCFVHGIMYGEAVPGKTTNSETKQIKELWKKAAWRRLTAKRSKPSPWQCAEDWKVIHIV